MLKNLRERKDITGITFTLLVLVRERIREPAPFAREQGVACVGGSALRAGAEE